MKNLRLVTLSLISVNCIVYVLLTYSGNNWILPDAGQLLNSGANFSGYTLGSDWWRLFTCMFVHVGLVHLVINMYALYNLGMELEEELGRLGFLLVYISCGLAGSVASLRFNDFMVSAGASGAILGLLGFHMMMLISGILTGKRGYFRHLLAALISLTMILVLGIITDLLDNAAHLGGLVCGLLCGGLFLLLKRTGSHRVLILAFISVLVSSASLLIYWNLSRFPLWYYGMYSTFFQNEREASRIISEHQGGTDDNAFKLQLEQADNLWSTNLQMVDSFPNAPLEYQNDVEMMREYSQLKKKIFGLYLKSLKYDSYLFIDSAEYVNNDIARLPGIQHPLDFFHKPEKEERGPRLSIVTVYFDKDWQRTTKEKMVYFRLAQEDSLHRLSGRVKDHYRDGTVQMKGDYTEDRKDGIFFYYYPNGWYESAGMYNNDVPVGKWQRFYDNHQIKMEERYEMGVHRVENFWSRTGQQLMKEGYGLFVDTYDDGTVKETGHYKEGQQDSIWTGYYPDGSKHYTELWKEGRLLNGKAVTLTGKEVFYDTVFVGPEPVGGMVAYMEHMNELTHGPVKGKKPPVVIVTLELTVEADGSVSHYEVITGYGTGFEKKAIELARNGPAFYPARLRGEKVREKVEIPFEFFVSGQGTK